MLTTVKPTLPFETGSTPPRYALEPDGSYRIERYDTAPAFCGFLPAIAGPEGVPLWCMYVNRAQGVVSFGVQDKDHAIAEFLPATWAYQLVGIQGFRTLCKINGTYYEPFQGPVADDAGCSRTLRIHADALELTEHHAGHGLTFSVQYFSPVNQPLGALVRRVNFRNSATRPIELTALDGLPLILPSGFTDHGLKTMRHIYEAYAAVRLALGHVPFYAAKVATHDEAEVVPLTGGNFYAAWLARGKEWRAVQPLVDPYIVFGAKQDLVTPREFMAREVLNRSAQVWENRLPCALVPLHAVLEPGETVEVTALVGYAPHEELLGKFLGRFAQRGDFERARGESQRLIEEVTAPCRTISGVPLLDAYTRQNFLDNVLRGGVPVEMPSRTGPALLHVYARRHGDLERDYNYFVLPQHPLSSGAGNYRDICQNRRWDAWFHSHVRAQDIRLFLSLLQADGYNPLAIEGYVWFAAPADAAAALCPPCAAAARKAFLQMLARGVRPGELLQWATLHDVTLSDRHAWLRDVLAQCEARPVARGHEGGYWIDHWTYVTDLLESYAAVYPDQVMQMLAGPEDIAWFDEGAYVRPRVDKYQTRTNGPLQIQAVVDGPRAVRPLPPVNVLGKLCALVAIKAVSFDYEGRGIEMEAGRPGWNDSLNGLPGLFGASTCEAAELARLAAWLRTHAGALPDTRLPAEVADFIEQVVADLAAPEYSWDRAATVRENLRARVREGASGAMRAVSGATLMQLLTGAERRAQVAVEKAIDPVSGLLHTYYVNTPVVRTPQATGGARATKVAETIARFEPRPLPLYLEGQVHWLRLASGRARARAIYQAVRGSPLFDTALRMYKLNECLGACPPDIGRARTFTRGWFENESIWLHMSYKYLLELLRAGLHDEFFSDADTMLVPFMNPEMYGRSVLENCSFLASSANPDAATHGRGFIARLSGSTAEFIHIWLLLTVGPEPFYVEREELRFRLRPVLRGEWFTSQATTSVHGGNVIEVPAGCFACTLLGTTLLVYHNETRRDTYGTAAVRPVRYELDGEVVEGATLGQAAAERLRARQVRRLDVWLA